MTANYPGSVYSPRTKANATGIVYDAADTDKIFAEDVQKLDAEVVAVETELGANPKGSDASVLARLNRIDSDKITFTDRGDPADWDFELVDLTLDYTDQEIDLSAIIPVGTKAVLLRVIISSEYANEFIQFYKPGSSNYKNCAYLNTQAIHNNMPADVWVYPDVDRCVGYIGSDSTWDIVNILVAGWLL